MYKLRLATKWRTQYGIERCKNVSIVSEIAYRLAACVVLRLIVLNGALQE